jgi:carbonic anhydrase/acetyltransferase-like protein (isoleucine patch superfamily)
MSIRCVNGVYLADTARVLGEVTLAPGVNIWYGVSVRGDVAPIVIGANTNVQDNTVIHCDKGFPNIIGANVTIGHGAILHGQAVGDGTLIGMGARLLRQSKIGKGCVIAAGALVPPGMVVPDGMVAMGAPAKVVRPTNDEEKAYLARIPPRYIENARLHAEHPEDPRVKPWGT